jgi:hypothetical protein
VRLDDGHGVGRRTLGAQRCLQHQDGVPGRSRLVRRQGHWAGMNLPSFTVIRIGS